MDAWIVADEAARLTSDLIAALRPMRELYERATQVHVPLVPSGPAFGPPVQERGMPIANPFKSIG